MMGQIMKGKHALYPFRVQYRYTERIEFVKYPNTYFYHGVTLTRGDELVYATSPGNAKHRVIENYRDKYDYTIYFDWQSVEPDGKIGYMLYKIHRELMGIRRAINIWKDSY